MQHGRAVVRVSPTRRLPRSNTERAAKVMSVANILSVGNELTTGRTVDTNASWLAGRLGELGISVGQIGVVGDDRPAIAAAIRRLADGCEVLVVTGGLGPTADDLTRQALADAMGVELRMHDELIEVIGSFFVRRGRRMPESNRSQALLPAGATPITNELGTAPGIRCRVGEAVIFVLPGVPPEMMRMFDKYVRPQLEELSGRQVILVKTLRCFGTGESDMGERIADLMGREHNPLIGTTAHEAVIGVHIRATARSSAEAETLVREAEAAVRQRLGDLVFGEGDETLADAVARLLWASGRTICVAESCTGGLLAKRLTDVPGASRYFVEGLVTYANDAKTRLLGVPSELIEQHGAVSERVAEAMAVGCRQRCGTDLALATTGIAGPEGGSPEKPVGLVYLALAHEAGCVVREVRIGSYLTRHQIRDRAAKSCLNLLRLHLIGSLSTSS